MMSQEPVYIEDWMNFYFYNVPDHPENEKNFGPELNSDLDQIPNRNVQPFAIYKTNGPIILLENKVHTQETVALLNQRGLDIYLTEPLCGYLEDAHVPPHGTKHNMWFYTEFRFHTDYSKLRADELDSIKNYAIRNGLTNITVHTGDYQVEEFYNYYSPHMKLICDDLFLKSSHDVFYMRHFSRPILKNKFINLNWRYTRHRHLVAAYLSRSASLISWNFKCSRQHLENGLYFNLPEFKDWYPTQFEKLVDGIDYLFEQAPLNLDLEVGGISEFSHHYFFNMWPKANNIPPGRTPNTKSRSSLLPYYRQSFVDIVNETRFAQPTANYSEKVYQAMFMLRPFILVAPPFTLKYLRSHGYKTFDRFWSETYDEETNHFKRLGMIFQLIDYIEGKSFEELTDLYVEMKNVLEYNRDLAYERLLKCKFSYLDVVTQPDRK